MIIMSSRTKLLLSIADVALKPWSMLWSNNKLNSLISTVNMQVNLLIQTSSFSTSQ